MLLSKKSKDLIPIQAQVMGMPEEDLQDMVNMYWKSIRDSLENLGYTEGSTEPNLAVYVEGFGTFRLIKHRIVTALPETERIFRRWKSPKRRIAVEQLRTILRKFDQEHEQMKVLMDEKVLYKQGYEVDVEPVEVDGKLQYIIEGHIYPDIKPSGSTYRKGCKCRACRSIHSGLQKERAYRRNLKKLTNGTKGETENSVGE